MFGLDSSFFLLKMSFIKIFSKTALQFARESQYLSHDQIETLESLVSPKVEVVEEREFELDREIESDCCPSESDRSVSATSGDLNNNMNSSAEIPVLLDMLKQNEAELRNLRSIVDRHGNLLRKFEKLLNEPKEEPESVD